MKSRLADKGYNLEEKLAADDKGLAWRKRRLAFCSAHKGKSEDQWVNTVQAVGDFKEFTYFPRAKDPAQAAKQQADHHEEGRADQAQLHETQEQVARPEDLQAGFEGEDAG